MIGKSESEYVEGSRPHKIGVVVGYASANDELKYQAGMSGTDAVIDFKEQRSSYLETRMYNLTATGIRWLDGATGQK